MEKKLEFTDKAKNQIEKITKSEEKNILEFQSKVVGVQVLSIILALITKLKKKMFYLIRLLSIKFH